jgi:hypothetical protein
MPAPAGEPAPSVGPAPAELPAALAPLRSVALKAGAMAVVATDDGGDVTWLRTSADSPWVRYAGEALLISAGDLWRWQVTRRSYQMIAEKCDASLVELLEACEDAGQLKPGCRAMREVRGAELLNLRTGKAMVVTPVPADNDFFCTLEYEPKVTLRSIWGGRATIVDLTYQNNLGAVHPYTMLTVYVLDLASGDWKQDSLLTADDHLATERFCLADPTQCRPCDQDYRQPGTVLDDPTMRGLRFDAVLAVPERICDATPRWRWTRAAEAPYALSCGDWASYSMSHETMMPFGPSGIWLPKLPCAELAGATVRGWSSLDR